MPSQRRSNVLTTSLLLTFACFAAFAFSKEREERERFLADGRFATPSTRPAATHVRSEARRRRAGGGDGVDKWIDLQLHPEKIDDSAVDARLSGFRTLRMDTREIVENFPPQQLIKAVAEGKSRCRPIR